MNTIKIIREKQNQLVTMINTTFDEIVKEVERLQTSDRNYEEKYESLYPLTNATGFKGKKVIAVKIGDHRIITATWKIAVKTILQEVIKDDTMKERVMILRDKLLGRVRKRISETPESMRSPLELCEDLYIETHYDTETLINLLLQILDEIKYDYNHIQIVIKN